MRAQQRIERTPELDSLQVELRATLNDLQAALSEAVEDPARLSAFIPHLRDDRPYLYELGYHGTFSRPFRTEVASFLKQAVDFQGLVMTDSLEASAFELFLEMEGEKITFSPFINRFTDVALWDRKLVYQLQAYRDKPNPYGSAAYQLAQVERRLKLGHFGDAASHIAKLKYFPDSITYTILKDYAAGKTWTEYDIKEPDVFYFALCEALSGFRNKTAARALLTIGIQRDFIDDPVFQTYLATITNLHPDFAPEGIALTDYVQEVLASMATLAEVRQTGFERILSYDEMDYDSEAEYYGNILLRFGYYPWVRQNATETLLNSGRPVALAFASTPVSHQIYNVDEYNWAAADRAAAEYLEVRTGVVLEVKTAEGEWTDQYEDLTSRINYVTYWLQHFEDYDFDTITQRYYNFAAAINLVDSVSYYFDHLYQPDDEAALEAFFRLTEQPADRVSTKVNQYDLSVMADNLNDKITSFAGRFLSQLTTLSAWYRDHQISYRINPQLRETMINLRGRVDRARRKSMEDSLINTLTPMDIIDLEYFLIVRAGEYSMGSSGSRILERWYGRNWWRLMEEDLELRSYLKRSYHYDRLGIIGNQNKYAQRFRDADDNLIERLHVIARTDTDTLIRAEATHALSFALNKNAPTSEAARRRAFEVAEFLAKEQVDLSGFNRLLDNHRFTVEQREKILTRISAIISCEDLLQLKLREGEMPSANFKMIAECIDPIEHIGKLLYFFSELPAAELFPTVLAMHDGLPTSASAEFMYEVGNAKGFTNWAAAGGLTTVEIENIVAELTEYKSGLATYQDYKRLKIASVVHALQYGSLPIQQQLLRVPADSAEDDRKALAKSILTEVDYEELSSVIRVAVDDPAIRELLPDLLIDDWGIPLVFPDSIPLLTELATRLENMEEIDLYAYYLMPYDLELKTDGRWNWLKVYDILEYDTIDGFVGGSGARMSNEYVYAVIRLLELEFKTRLGEPRKFNNLLNSRSWSRAERAKQWQWYLLEEGLVNLPADYVYSVSNVVDR